LFKSPLDVAVAPNGRIYVADFGNKQSDPNEGSVWLLNPTASGNTPVVIITESNQSTVVAEGESLADTYTVRLSHQPTANVTIDIDPDFQVQTNQAGLTFTPNNWNSPQTVSVAAIDDDVAEGTHNGVITHRSSSTDSRYDNISVQRVVAEIADNDDIFVAPAVVVSESNQSTSVSEEEATADTYTIRLSTQPTTDVTVTLTPDAQVEVDQPTLTFTVSNWDTPQTVTLTAVDDDAIEGAHTGTITHQVSSADSEYDDLAVPAVVADITDNDVAVIPAVKITETDQITAVAEDGTVTDTYSISLSTQPSEDVTVTLTPDAQVEVDQPTLTFTVSNWDTPQTVTVTAVDDDAIEGAHTGTVTHQVSSADTAYEGLAVATVVADITDNDSNPVTATEQTLQAEDAVIMGAVVDDRQAGATGEPPAYVDFRGQGSASNPDDTYIEWTTEIEAGGQYALNWRYSLGSGDRPLGVMVNGIIIEPSLSFANTSDWNSWQFLEQSVLADLVVGKNTVRLFAIGSSGANFDLLRVTSGSLPEVPPSVLLTESNQSTVVAEDGTVTDTYSISLSTQPSEDVTVTLTPDAQVEVDQPTLTFTVSNWDTPQTVTVTAVDDDAVEGNHTGTVTHQVSSADTVYDGLAVADVIADITDNDVAVTPAVLISETDQSTAVAEDGTVTDTYSISLSTQPTEDVMVTLTPDAQVEVDQPTLTFTVSNWDTPQTVTVTAVDDDAVEGNHTGTVTHQVSSADTVYDGLAVADVIADITDNDVAVTPAVLISETDQSTAVAEDGTVTDTYSISLSTQPSEDVTVTLTPDAQVEVDQPTLTFTVSNWDTPQTVTVTAVDDDAVEGNHTGTVTHQVSSADTVYDGLAVADVIADITDNDVAVTPAVLISETDQSTAVAEDGTVTDTYSISLSTQPTEDVMVTLTPDAQVEVDQPTLTFTVSNWDTPQTVTVTAVDDDAVEGNHTGTVTHQVSSADTVYDGLAVADVIADITDNDVAVTPAVLISETDQSTAVAEDGTVTDTYSISLSTQPTEDVMVTLTPDAQVEVDQPTLTFTVSNWDTPQTVTVTAVDDDAVEGNHTGTVTHQVSSADTVYDGLAVATVVADITDNDSNPVTATEQTLQAEDAVIMGAVVDDRQAEATGEPPAYVDFRGQGSASNPDDTYIEWTTEIEAGGQYALNWRYSLGSGDRPLGVMVNGIIIEPSLSFANTSDWNSWQFLEQSVLADLVVGKNTVRLFAIGSSGANFDLLRVTRL
jgi:predicted deacylase